MIDYTLKFCPFCDGFPHLYEDQRFSHKCYDFPKWYIKCVSCGIRTPTATIEQVVKIWNRRSNDEF